MPSLLILAAGLGSRYGGLKQIDPVGPSGETLLDYAVFDALRAGFDRMVFVIRRDFERAFRDQVAAKYAGSAAVDFAFQSLDMLPAGFSPPAGREKPWGTGHAVWCARDVVKDGFAAINADDFYGADAFRKLATFLRGQVDDRDPAPARGRDHRPDPFALAGFRLADTLSEHGAVARGVCASEAGRLQSIVERTDIVAVDVGPGKRYSGNEVVSMNCWGFTPALFSLLDSRLREFLVAQGRELKAEFYLPSAISALIAGGQAEVTVLPATGSWFGITYREDKPRVAAAIADLVRRGTYPARLF
jgi:hypothetical protein